MPPKTKEPLEQRVIRAAEAALADHHYVIVIDVLTGMGLLAVSHVEAWRKGRIDFLEPVIQGSPEKLSSVAATFRSWAEAKGLHASETAYKARTRTGARDLQFSESGDLFHQEVLPHSLRVGGAIRAQTQEHRGAPCGAS